MKHVETTWKSSDELEIYSRGWIPELIPARAVVCLVHGVGEHTGRYRKVAELLSENGFILMGADLRGHGKSEGKRGHFPSIEVIHKDIDRLLSEARSLFPGLPLFLYGHSLGGILVLHYGLKSAPDVKGVISTSPGLHNALEKQPVKVLAAKLLGTLLPGLTIPSGLDAAALSHDPQVVKDYMSDPLVHNKLSMGFGKIMLEVNSFTLKNARNFQLPLLLMHGKGDSVSFPSGSIDFAASLTEKCTLILWEEAWHELHNEPIGNEVLKSMTAWMDKQL